MLQSRLIRALAVLVLVLAQVALGLPHHMVMGQAAQAHAATPMAGGAAHAHCDHGGGAPARSDAPMPPCSSCPASMPGPQTGGCLDMATCGPVSAVASAPSLDAVATVTAAEFTPVTAAPAAHDFIPDPPPPRA